MKTSDKVENKSRKRKKRACDMVQQDHLAKGGTVEQPEAFYLLELSCQVGGVFATHGGVQVHHLADRTLLPP